jgi:ribosome-associated protein
MQASDAKAKLNGKELAQYVEGVLDDLKGESITSIDVRELTEITDYMIIVTGRSSTHIKALADEVVTRVKEVGVTVVGVEGKMQSEWVLVDAGDVVVHIMLAAVRALYNLEDLWNFNNEAKASKKSRSAD